MCIGEGFRVFVVVDRMMIGPFFEGGGGGGDEGRLETSQVSDSRR